MFLGVSCETPFDELNNDPTSLTEAELRLMLPEAITQSMFSEGTAGNRAIGIIMQQFIGIDAQQLEYTDYVLGENLMNNYWRTGLYAGALKSCDDIIARANDQGATFYSGVAKIVMANQYGIATSWFGDIPFSQALKGSDNLKPTYDSQESVYVGVLAMLDDAIVDLGSAAGYGGGDLIYGGDAASWIKTARGLKARFLMHQAKRNAGNYAAALTEIDASYASAAEQSNFTFGTANTQNYALAQFAIGRPGTLGIDARFAARMDGDPRQSLYMSESEGVWLIDSEDGLKWTTNDATVPMLSYSELMFMKAEIALQMGGDATAPLTNAIVSSCLQAGTSEDDAMTYAASVTGGTVNLETVITEAYKGYFGYAFHTTWSNWRRTGIPSLTPSSNGTNGFNPGGGVPVRFLYPDSEGQTNSANLEAAKASQGGALLNATIWAYQ